ncbi:MAG: helix-turn-helix domain-containing protein, partial [Pseudomonadota bacterium]|nr:helix-turn-helix domain-containing protein [Pseudomonadota bacterium]
AQGKVVSFLLSLSKRSHARVAPSSPISLPMNRADIADYLGLTTETVGNTFTSLRGSDGIRLLAGNSVPLENFESLFELADGS